MAKEVFATTPKVTTERKPITTPAAPQQVRIYYKDGGFQDVFPVDAKEAVQGGEYSYEPPSASDLADAEKADDKAEKAAEKVAEKAADAQVAVADKKLGGK